MSSFDPRLGNNAVLISQLLGVGTGQNPGANQTGAQQAASKAERDKDDENTKDADGKPAPKHGQARGAGASNAANPAVQGDKSGGQQGQGGDKQSGAGSIHSESSGAAISPAEVQKMALAGLSGVDEPSAQRSGGTNKFGTDQTILQSPVPMPPDAPRMTQRSGQLYQAMSKDISQALAAGGAKQTGADLQAATTQFKNMATQLNEQTLGSAAGAKQAGQASGTLGARLGRDLLSMIGGDSLAAFMMLNVVNRQSGKETMSALQDMMTKARNNQIQAQIKEQEAAAEKAKEALKKQELMKKLGPIIEAIVTAIMLAVTALTFGAAAPATLFVIGATVAGFIAGGAIGGAKNGKGFDFASAMTGAGIGGAIGGLATAPVRMAIVAIIKFIASALEKVGMKALAKTLTTQAAKLAAKKGATTAGTSAGKKAGEEALEQEAARQARQQAQGKASEKTLRQAEKNTGTKTEKADSEDDVAEAGSSKDGGGGPPEGGADSASQAGNKGLNALLTNSKANFLAQTMAGGVNMGSQIAMGIENYLVSMANLEAKKHQANAKEAKVLSESLQNNWESIQKTLSGILEHHESNVNQMTQMMSSHHQADINAVSGIAGRG